MTEKKRTYHVFLSSEEDIHINNEKIELFLNNLVPQGCTIRCIKKHKNIKLSHKDLHDLKDSSIYVVDAHRGLDNISYWELGYAMGKGLEVIGYYDGKSEIKISRDVKELIGIDETIDDIKRFVDTINRTLADLKPKEYPFSEDWDKQYVPSKKEGGAT